MANKASKMKVWASVDEQSVKQQPFHKSFDEWKIAATFDSDISHLHRHLNNIWYY